MESGLGRGLGLSWLVEPEEQFDSRNGMLCLARPADSRAVNSFSATRHAIVSPTNAMDDERSTCDATT